MWKLRVCALTLFFFQFLNFRTRTLILISIYCYYSICKPKELWEALKSLGLPSKTSICGTTALKVKNATSFETKSKLEVFENYYSTLAENLFKKLPIPPNIYAFNSVRQYYRHLFQNDAFHLTYTTEIDIEKILRGTKVCRYSCRYR